MATEPELVTLQINEVGESTALLRGGCVAGEAYSLRSTVLRSEYASPATPIPIEVVDGGIFLRCEGEAQIADSRWGFGASCGLKFREETGRFSPSQSVTA